MKKTEKKETNKSKIILLIIFLLLAVLTVIIMNSKSAIKSDDNGPKLTNEVAEKLIYNNFMYYVLSTGNVPLNGYVIYQGEEAYNGIDFKVDDISTIDNTIINAFANKYTDILIRNMYGDANKKSLKFDNKIYINYAKEDENCKLENIDLSKYKILKNNGTYYIQYRTDKYYQEVPVVYEEDKWKLNGIIEFCM